MSWRDLIEYFWRHEMLVLKNIETLEEAQVLRNIRNECKDFMTRDTSYISVEQQIRWFNSLKREDKKDYKIYLLYEVINGVVATAIGYGLIKKEGSFSLISGGLIESCRGKGYGSTLFTYLIGNVDAGSDIKLEVLKSNTRAFVIYNKLGFRVISDDGEIITMEYHYDSQI